MPPRSSPFSRKNATTYALVHRPQNDPLIHDADSPAQVFTEIAAKNTLTNQAQPSSSRSKKVKHRGDLEEEFGISYRSNEGEAAEHGVFFDDSQYDYMQHMRDLGAGAGDAAWIEPPSEKGKGKGKQKLEDALRNVSLDDDDLRSDGGASAYTSQSGYSNYSGYTGASQSAYGGAPVRGVVEQQQDVPDALKGFQPDMDPRLREALEALEDEAYVDDEDDLFTKLQDGAEEVDQYDWEEQGLDVDDDGDEGWESDDTEKPSREYAATPSVEATPSPPHGGADIKDNALPDPHAAPPDAPDALPSRTDLSAAKPPRPAPPTASIAPSSASQIPGPHKKRKGALTSKTGGSMTSSVLARSEALSTLDARFDRLYDDYLSDLPEMDDDDDDDEDGGASLASGMTGMTGMTSASRASAWTTATDGRRVQRLADNAALDGAMDAFLDEGTGKGRRMRKGGAGGTVVDGRGMSQLDEVRSGLGPARLKARDGRATGVRI